MHTELIIIHVISMVVSLALMSSAVVAGVFGKTSAVRIASIGMLITAVGVGTGAALLLSTPLDLKCAILTTYLFGTSALYIFGFGMGTIEKARFIRSSASIQES